MIWQVDTGQCYVSTKTTIL